MNLSVVGRNVAPEPGPIGPCSARQLISPQKPGRLLSNTPKTIATLLSFDRNSTAVSLFLCLRRAASLFTALFHLHHRRFKFQVRVSPSEPRSRAIVKLDRHRGDRYGNNSNNQDASGYRQSRGPSRFSDAPLNSHRGRRSPGNFRGGGGGGGGGRRPFDSPPRHGPGGFRPAGGRGGGDDGYRGAGGGGGGGRGFGQGYDAPPPPPPLAGQKRGFSGRGGGSPNPDHFDGAAFAKLFVGSVPRSATEEDIRPLFEEHGNVVEVAMIKDKRTGLQQGCCFIKYATSEEADRAIRALHNQYTLPGGLGPVQVRYADGERERLGAFEYKLFVGSLNKQATVKEVEEIFSPYGRVEDVYLMRDEMKQSRGCGFVKYSHRDMALAAINALNGNYTMRGCDQPLTVRFADPKRPRLGDTSSKGGPAFGGPGFGPHFQAPELRGPPNFSDTVGDRIAPSAWNPMNAQNLGPSSFSGHPNFGGQLFPKSGDVSKPLNPNNPLAGPGVPTDGLLPSPAAPSSSMAQQSFQPFQQFPSVGQQIAPLQKSLQSPQPSLPSLSHNQPSTSYPQTQASHVMLGQLNQLQSPPLATPFSQPLPSQPLVGSSGQLSATHPVAQQTASSVTAQQAPLNMNLLSQPRLTAINQPQVPAPGQQHLLQSFQQSPSTLAQMLSQQTQALQASFQSSQHAFSQLQQQLQMMQPSNLNAVPQQALPANQQPQWNNNGQQPVLSTSTATSAEVPSSSSVAPAIAVSTPNLAPVKCIWTEHTSPDGFKYYYNSVTGESRWLEPEELKIFRQQQQQQQQQPPKSSVQLTHAQRPQLLPTQQGVQTQQPQQQSQLQGQLPQQLLQQPLLSSSYQASGLPSHHMQELGYSQFQVAANSVNDPARFQQGFQAAQQWMLKNKSTGA